MNYHAYYPIDFVNGPGTRATLFVSGCAHRCVGCYNRKTWHPKSGQPFTQSLAEQIFSDLASNEIPRQGLSLSGGDPLFPANVPTLLELVKRIKTQLPEKDIWCWTGYTRAQVTAEQLALVRYCDVIVDGQFIAAQKSAKLVWRGSANQQIVSAQEWLRGARASELGHLPLSLLA